MGKVHHLNSSAAAAADTGAEQSSLKRSAGFFARNLLHFRRGAEQSADSGGRLDSRRPRPLRDMSYGFKVAAAEEGEKEDPQGSTGTDGGAA